MSTSLRRKFLGQYIKELRKQKQVSAYRLAKELGISPPHYYALEKGDVENCVSLFKQIFKLYNIPYPPKGV